MKRKTVKFLLSVGVLAVLGGVYAGVEKYTESQEKQEEEAEEEQKEVVSIASQDIVSLKFMVDKQAVSFEKKDDQWIKSDEPEFPVNQEKLTEAAGQFSEMIADRILEQVDQIAEYGLDVPANTITVTTEDGTETILKIGMENEDTSQYYVEKDGDESTVYVVESSKIAPFEKKLYDYAQQESFPTVDSASITEIQVQKFEKDDTGYTLKKNEDTGLWSISGKNHEEKADSSKATTLASAVAGITYEGLVDYNCKDPGKYGLETPYAAISVGYKEEVEADSSEETSEENKAADESQGDVSQDTGDTGEETEAEEPEVVSVDRILDIQIGSEADTHSRYVCVNGSNEIYTISQEALAEILDQTENDYWDLTVNNMSANVLDHLNLEYKNVEHVLSVSRETSTDEDGNETENTVYALDEKEIDSTEFSQFYNKLVNMVGQERLTDPYEPSETADLCVTFEDVDGNKEEVKFYSYDTNFYAAVKEEKVYLINKMTFKEMITVLDDLLDVKQREEKDATDTTAGVDTEEGSEVQAEK